jgi:hypothetical protein
MVRMGCATADQYKEPGYLLSPKQSSFRFDPVDRNLASSSLFSRNAKQRLRIMFVNIPTTLLLLVASLALPTNAGIQEKDFSGIGHIYVLASDGWSTATPESTVGCLDARGRFVHDSGRSKECGIYERREDYPWTLSTQNGNCTFQDESQEENVDSHYGHGDYAWTCTERNVDIYDELYTIVRIIPSETKIHS